MPGRNITVVAGISGMGKTTFALRYLANVDASERFLFDPDPGEQPLPQDKGEYAARLGLPQADDVHSLGMGLVRGWVLFDPNQLFAGRPEIGFQFFCEWAFEKAGQIPGRKILLLDEVYCYQSTRSIPIEFAKCIHSGRRRGLHVIITSHQPNALNDTIKAGVSEFVSFRLQAPAALDLVKDYYGFNPDEVSALPPLHFVARNVDTGGELRGKIKI